MKKKSKAEIKYYGIQACQQLWSKRPNEVIRVYLIQSRLKELSSLLKWCAKQGKAYHVVTSAELDKISQSKHHEGVCLLARAIPEPKFDSVLASLSKDKHSPQLLLYLDDIQNPQNIGSIMRVSAHFGVSYLLGDKLPRLTPSAYRVAEGAGELVRLVRLSQPESQLKKLKSLGFTCLATSSHRGKSLYDFHCSPRTLIIMGNEVKGVSQPLFKLADETLQIPGTGNVESLNVSVATSLFLSEYWRQIS